MTEPLLRAEGLSRSFEGRRRLFHETPKVRAVAELDLTLDRGDALHFNAQKPHRIRSVGEVQAQLLVVVHSAEE